MKRAQPERQFHKAVADMLRVGLIPPAFASTIGHGGGGRIRGAILKTMGVVAGLPDILLFHDSAAFGLELKSSVGKLSSPQIACHFKLRQAKIPVEVCRSLNDVIRALDSWRIPHRINESSLLDRRITAARRVA
jgi:hypothetical protein